MAELTLLDTALERVALCLYDAHPDIRDALWQPDYTSVDIAKRPAWRVSDTGAGYAWADSTAGSVRWTERVRCELISHPFGQGLRHREYARTRDILMSTIQYLVAHRRLQFSNQRARAGYSPSPPLDYVWQIEWEREPLTLYRMDGGEDSDYSWGGVLTLTLHCQSIAPTEVVI